MAMGAAPTGAVGSFGAGRALAERARAPVDTPATGAAVVRSFRSARSAGR